MNDDRLWWKHGVIYQIYPRSFRDANGDGVGDLAGVMERLDYLADLGVDGIWLSPIFASPMRDAGYDVSDYCAIDPVFGTLDEFDRLVVEAHRRGIRIILDLVLNHTSDQHPWFLDSRASASSPKRDWYVWHSGRYRRGRAIRRGHRGWPAGEGGAGGPDRSRRPGPPNNWRSAFGGSAWQWDESSRQYYLHLFLAEQPDLNWRNPDVQEAMLEVVQFWLDRGVDGFRLDVINFIFKDADLRSNPYRIRAAYPRRYEQQLHVHERNQPETHAFLRRLRRLVDGYGQRMLVGEVDPDVGVDEAQSSAAYLGDGENELHLAFDFEPMCARFSAQAMGEALQRWYEAVPERGWPCHVMNNHDRSRAMTAHCHGDVRKARLLAALLLTQRGTPFLYYGEEIGMRNTRVRRGQLRDPVGIRYWPLHPGRDPARCPMQWSPDDGAGFTTSSRPWLPIDLTSAVVNVDDQSRQPGSLLSWYRALIALRRSSATLQRGEIRFLDAHQDVLAYERACRGRGNERLTVFLNFAGRPRPLPVIAQCPSRSQMPSDVSAAHADTLLSSEWADYVITGRVAPSPDKLALLPDTLAPYEARIVAFR